MSKERGLTIWGIAVVILALGGLAAATLQDAAVMRPVKPKPAKICPINFILDPVTTLQQHYAADIEKTNARLSQDFSFFRDEIIRKSLDFDAFVARCQRTYQGTYLERPVLWGDDGNEYKGWDRISKYLASVIPHTTYIHPQGVNVYLEYLPPDMQTEDYLVNKRSVNLRGYRPDEVDFLAMIRTVIAYAPYDDPMEIGNEGPIPHRKICDPIY
jgi:hypothetical protein